MRLPHGAFRGTDHGDVAGVIDGAWRTVHGTREDEDKERYKVHGTRLKSLYGIFLVPCTVNRAPAYVLSICDRGIQS